ncbi:MAG: hypothetical protein LBK53_05330 [Heliobacteriaceae bacterium]|jgi:hypothetical protein|nr:hypothetical protein [Heliobacteriaceae bacterium]
MKNKLLILMLLITAPALAGEFTVDDAASREYLINHGHSQVIYNAIERTKAQVNGTPYDETAGAEYPDSGPVKWVRSFFMYFDPALDSEAFMKHDIKFAPQIDDL